MAPHPKIENYTQRSLALIRKHIISRSYMIMSRVWGPYRSCISAAQVPKPYGYPPSTCCATTREPSTCLLTSFHTTCAALLSKPLSLCCPGLRNMWIGTVCRLIDKTPMQANCPDKDCLKYQSRIKFGSIILRDFI